MTTHTVAKYWLTDVRTGKRYISSWRMTPSEAAKRGLTDSDIVPGTTEQRADLGLQSAGKDGARSTKGNEDEAT